MSTKFLSSDEARLRRGLGRSSENFRRINDLTLSLSNITLIVQKHFLRNLTGFNPQTLNLCKQEAIEDVFAAVLYLNSIGVPGEFLFLNVDTEIKEILQSTLGQPTGTRGDFIRDDITSLIRSPWFENEISITTSGHSDVTTKIKDGPSGLTIKNNLVEAVVDTAIEKIIEYCRTTGKHIYLHQLNDDPYDAASRIKTAVEKDPNSAGRVTVVNKNLAHRLMPFSLAARGFAGRNIPYVDVKNALPQKRTTEHYDYPTIAQNFRRAVEALPKSSLARPIGLQTANEIDATAKFIGIATSPDYTRTSTYDPKPSTAKKLGRMLRVIDMNLDTIHAGGDQSSLSGFFHEISKQIRWHSERMRRHSDDSMEIDREAAAEIAEKAITYG